MVDVCLQVAAKMATRSPGEWVAGAEKERFFLATIHRPGNTDDFERLASLVQVLKDLPMPVVLPVHPRLRAKADQAGVALEGGSLRAVEPLPYMAMVVLTRDSAAVLTDSGGLQKEAYILGRTCMTLKADTEWTETLEDGWNLLQPEGGTCPWEDLHDTQSRYRADRDSRGWMESPAA